MTTAADAITDRVGVVIPAAGQGKRFGSVENKIWAQIAGKTVLDRTLEAFNDHPAVHQIAVSASAEELQRVRSAAARYVKVTSVVAGGLTRAHSVKNGVDALAPGTTIVLVHDAARPLVSQALISRVIEAVKQHGAAVPGLPVYDTLKRVSGSGIVRATIPRSARIGDEELVGLTSVQTPQGAGFDLLTRAFASVDLSSREITDEASLIEAYGGKVAIAVGDAANIKITRQADIAEVERLLAPVETRTGFGYDVHAFAEPEAGRTLFLGGVAIPHFRGLDGHSDADVLLHAICDALLGAASLGDIGILFPNTDATYKNISSLRLLNEVNSRLTAGGWRVVNIDATVVAEAPKLMPHREAIQRAVSRELQIEEDRVSVKATTSERMGFIGREEGIACWAVAVIAR